MEFVIARSCFRKVAWPCTSASALGLASTEMAILNKYGRSGKYWMVKPRNCWKNLVRRWIHARKRCNLNVQDTIVISFARFARPLVSTLFQVNCTVIAMPLDSQNKVTWQHWLSCMQMMALSRDRRSGHLFTEAILGKP